LKKILLLLFSITGLSATAQDYLVLEKMGTKKRYEYFPDDQLTFKIVDEEHFRKDRIVALSDSSILFASGRVPLKEIERIKPPASSWMAATGGTLVIAGIGYYLIDTFNQTVIAGNKYSNDEAVLRTSLILAGTGAGLILFSTKKVKLNNNWRIRMVDIY